MVRNERPYSDDSNNRRYSNERQPVLPFNAAYQVMNQRDQERETHNPMQLELLPPVQPDMFIDMPVVEGDVSQATQGQ